MPSGAAARHHALRILEIGVLTDNSDNDIEQISSITYFRDAQSRAASNGFSPDALAASSEGATASALATSLATTADGEVWIFFSEVVPPVSVIILNQTTQA